MKGKNTIKLENNIVKESTIGYDLNNTVIYHYVDGIFNAFYSSINTLTQLKADKCVEIFTFIYKNNNVNHAIRLAN